MKPIALQQPDIGIELGPFGPSSIPMYGCCRLLSTSIHRYRAAACSSLDVDSQCVELPPLRQFMGCFSIKQPLGAANCCSIVWGCYLQPIFRAAMGCPLLWSVSFQTDLDTLKAAGSQWPIDLLPEEIFGQRLLRLPRFN